MIGRKRRVHAESAASVRCICPADHDPGHFATESVVEKVSHAIVCRRLRGAQQSGRKLPIAARPVGIEQADVVGRVAEDQIVQECGRDNLGHPGEKADARAVKLVLDGGKTVLDVAPLGNGGRSVPLIVDVAKRALNILSEILIDSE